MLKASRLRFVFIVIVFVFFTFYSPEFLRSETLPKGNIIGFVYAEDGTTPLEGAIVIFKNISTGSVYKSSKSDRYGAFKIKDVERGLYFYGVITPEGEFTSDRVMGVKIHTNETVKLAISLIPYEKKVTAAIKELNEELEEKGEVLVGRVIYYDPDIRRAEVYIMRRLLRMKDRIHAKGEVTDFYQDVNVLKMEGVSVEMIFAGQTAFLEMKSIVEADDLIYVVPKKRFFLLTPLGIASIIAGTSAIVYGITLIPPPKPTSPFTVSKR